MFLELKKKKWFFDDRKNKSVFYMFKKYEKDFLRREFHS